jgi:hypothetical protein
VSASISAVGGEAFAALLNALAPVALLFVAVFLVVLAEATFTWLFFAERPRRSGHSQRVNVRSSASARIAEAAYRLFDAAWEATGSGGVVHSGASRRQRRVYLSAPELVECAPFG